MTHQRAAAQPQLILASKSPRRLEILENLGLSVTVQAFDTDEALPPDIAPRAAVLLLAKRKAEAALRALGALESSGGEKRSVALHIPNDAIILAADTVVALGNEIFGKPRDRADATDMLHRLSGTTHRVYTGMAVAGIGSTQIYADVSESIVTFRCLSDEEIGAYVASGEPLDKAGAYGIQLCGSMLVDSIDGDFFGIMGLSPAVLFGLLRDHFGYNLLTQQYTC